jgi:hypothetical protein
MPAERSEQVVDLSCDAAGEGEVLCQRLADLYDGTLRMAMPLTRTRTERQRTGVYGILSEGPDWQKSVRHGKLRSGKYTTCALWKERKRRRDPATALTNDVQT